MFTGIIEEVGYVKELIVSQTNKTFFIESSFTKELKIGDSISHNGVCLTVEKIITEKQYQITAILETLKKTNLNFLQKGQKVNLERSLQANQRIDGHFVQGHVDCIGMIQEYQDKNGSIEFKIAYPAIHQELVIPRGSIAVDGISLTISDIDDSIQTIEFFENQQKVSFFYVNIIPHTFRITNVQDWQVNTFVNLEFDVLGKYIKRFLEIHKT